MPPIVRLVSDLYGCLAQAEPTSAALDVMCSAIGATHAIMMQSGHDGTELTTSHHLATVARAQLGNLDRSEEYRQLLGSASSGSVIRMTDLVAREALLRSDLYNTTLRALDGGLAIYGMQGSGSALTVTAICRSAVRDPDFDEDMADLVRAALPHLVAVTGIANRLRTERQNSQQAHAALDGIGDGVLVLAPNGRLIQRNAAAEALLISGDRIARWDGRLIASDRLDDVRLQRAIAAVRLRTAGTDGCANAVAISEPCQVVLGRGRPGWPLIATVLPANAAAGGDPHDGTVIVQLRDPNGTACLSDQALRQELKLTIREAELVRELAYGATLTEASRTMTISVGTARQYLKTIFQKAGVRGQAELLRLVCR